MGEDRLKQILFDIRRAVYAELDPGKAILQVWGVIQGANMSGSPSTFLYDDFVHTLWKATAPPTNHRDATHMLLYKTIEEVGEVAKVFMAHFFRDKRNVRDHLREELGDLLFMVTMLGREHGFSLAELQESNRQKLLKRFGSDYALHKYTWNNGVLEKVSDP